MIKPQLFNLISLHCVFGKGHESTANSYMELGVAQVNKHDYTSALQRAFGNRVNIFGEEHEHVPLLDIASCSSV